MFLQINKTIANDYVLVDDEFHFCKILTIKATKNIRHNCATKSIL